MTETPEDPRRHARPESVLVVVYTLDGQTLLLERCQPAGYWQSVTGAIRWGETPEQAARRELREETGFEARGALVDCARAVRFRIAPAWRHRYAPELSHNLEHHFTLALGSPRAPRLEPAEHLDYRWLPFLGALELVSSESNREAIERVMEAHG